MNEKPVNFAIDSLAKKWMDENCPGEAYIAGLISQPDDRWVVGWYAREKVESPSFPGFVATNNVGNQLVIVQTNTEAQLANMIVGYEEGGFKLSTKS